MAAIESYINSRTMNLVLFLGQYTFFDLHKLLELLTDIYSIKINAPLTAITTLRTELEAADSG